MTKILPLPRAAFRPLALLLLASASIPQATIAPAHAANFTASNEAEFVAAIASANASADASSTITLTNGFVVTGTLPSVSKTLNINTGSFTLGTSGNQSLNVATGGNLTVTGNTTGSGASGSGRLFKQGGGTTVLTGVTGSYSGSLSMEGGTLRIDGGSKIAVGSVGGDGSLKLTGATPVHLILSGAGTVLTGRVGSADMATTGVATMTIESGARYEGAQNFTMARNAGSLATLNVTGVNSLFKGPGINIAGGTGIINVTGGGRVETSTSVNLGGTAGIPSAAGTGALTIAGSGSALVNGGIFYHFRGTVDVLAGGELTTASLRIAPTASTAASVLVSGPGSVLNTTGAADITVGALGDGALTVANGGQINVRAGSGTISLASGAAGKATLNIGGASGAPATASGTISAAAITFGAGAGVINFNHTDPAYGFDIAINGNGTINHTGSGKTRFTANQLGFSGQTNVRAGIFEVNGRLGGSMAVLGGRLQGTGTVGATRNAAGGTIAPGNSIGTLTIGGNYTSDGGALEIESVLGNDASAADLLVITGDSLLDLAPTQVKVINVGGTGGETVNGIRIVDVQGAVSQADVFALNGPAIGGAYTYGLYQGTPTSADGDWYLRNTGVLAPTTPALENYPVALLGMIGLPTLRQRVGEREAAEPGIFTRIEGGMGHHAMATSTTGLSYDSSLFLAQVGIEGDLVGDDGVLTLGLTGQYGWQSANVASALGSGSNGTESFGIGGTATWRGDTGFYLDLQGQVAGFLTDLEAAGRSLVSNNPGIGYAVGAEVGQTIDLDDVWSLTPQGQLTYSSVDFQTFTDSFGSVTALQAGDSLLGRLGLSLDYETEESRLYGIGNLTYEFLQGATVQVSGTPLQSVPQRFGAELGLGGTLDFNGGAQRLHGEILAATSFAGSTSVKGTIGFSGKF